MNESAKPDDNALAYTGISLLGNAAVGEPPEWHELQAWRSGQLSAERSAEVLSYVANHPNVFQQWLDLVEAEQWAADELLTPEPAQTSTQAQHTSANATQPASARKPEFSLAHLLQKTTSWLQSVVQQPVYGGALAAVLLAVLVVPLMRQTEQASLQQQLDRSLDTYIGHHSTLPGSIPSARNSRNLGGLFNELSATDVERHAFKFGLYSAGSTFPAPANAAWQSWLTELPNSQPDCNSALDSAHCQVVSGDLALLGKWTLLTYAQCQLTEQQTDRATTPEGTDATQLAQVYERLRAIEALQTSTLFGKQLSAGDNLSPEVVCDTADQLLLTGQ